MNLKPELLKNGHIPAIWQDADLLPIYRYHGFKRRFRLAPVDVVLISIIVASSIIYLVR